MTPIWMGGLMLAALAAPDVEAAADPAFDCSKVRSGSMAAQVCADPALALLDRQLAEVYRAALGKARHQHPPVLKAEQRGWVKGRDDC